MWSFLPVPADQSQEGDGPAPTTSLRSQRKVPLFARTFAPARKAVKKNASGDKEGAGEVSGKEREDSRKEKEATGEDAGKQDGGKYPGKIKEEVGDDVRKQDGGKYSGKIKEAGEDGGKQDGGKYSGKDKEASRLATSDIPLLEPSPSLERIPMTNKGATKFSTEEMPLKSSRSQFYVEEVPLPTLSPKAEYHSPRLARRPHTFVESPGQGIGWSRFSPLATTVASPRMSSTRKKGAPLPGAKWVHKLLL
ncbi:hypothetical protein JRQ81_007199 [Phrynocephalus forsythii]|uniref:Uncharacterized protein n=1 Tax=Phrynocephalus forsythii TaxID=171643 RepID=A0A9Q1ATZ5_9SAUR|nr:hypothetical protein JRQ81_007199 [Phrynocephalus forsythii]